MKIRILIFLFFISVLTFSQKSITLINADLEEVNEKVFDGNMVYSGNVIMQHDTSRFVADSVIFYQSTNNIEGRGNITFTNKENTMTCKKIVYNGNTKKAVAYGNVILRSPDQRVETEKMEYDVNTEIAFFNEWGTIYSKDDIINTKEARYYSKEKRTQFLVHTKLRNKQYTVEGPNIQYFSNTHIVDFIGYTVITDIKRPNTFILSDKGKYNTVTKEAFLKENNKVHYDKKILYGDDIYFNQLSGVGKARGNVKLDDPEERRFLKGGYGEVYQLQDSAIVIEKPYVVKAFETDSLYFHSDTIIAIKNKEKASILRGYHKARMYKSEMSGKSDSIVFNETTGKMDFYTDPIVWFGYKQMTGDSITGYMNVQTNQLDSIYVRNNAFLISKVDSLSPKEEYDQVKGKVMNIYLKDQKLNIARVVGNAESVVYAEEDDKKTQSKKRIGIAKSTCGIIETEFEEGQIETISCLIKGESKVYPESQYPEEMRFMHNFNWRGEERLVKWTDIFLNNAKDRDSIKNKETDRLLTEELKEDILPQTEEQIEEIEEKQKRLGELEKTPQKSEENNLNVDKKIEEAPETKKELKVKRKALKKNKTKPF